MWTNSRCRSAERPRLGLLAALAGATALLAACAGNSSSSGSPAFSAKLSPTKTTTLALERIQIVVPPAAVASDVVVQLLKPKKGNVAYGTQIGSAYVTFPSDLEFAVPADVKYGYGDIALPEGADEANLQLAFLGPSGLPTFLATTIDTDAKTATASIDHLGQLALVLFPTPVVVENGAGSLVFLRKGAEDLPDLWQATPNGAGPQLVTAHTAGETLSSPRVSAAASRAAFTETAGGGVTNKAWIVALDGSGRTQVTADGSDETVGDLDAAGQLLFVTHKEPGEPFGDLAVYNLSGVPPYPRVLLTTTPSESEQNPRISPDGQTLLFQDSQLEVFRMAPIAGSPPKKVVTIPVVNYAWRPDGQRIVVERQLSTGTGSGDVGGGLVEVKPFSTSPSLGSALKGSGGAHSPTYSANGDNLIFLFQDEDRSILAPTLRQIPRKGLTSSIVQGGAILLGGASVVFLGEAPSCVP